MRKLFFLVLATMILGGCTQKTTTVPESSGQEKESTMTEITGNCITEAVDIVGYGDKGKRLANCFVQYPGEPSRQTDKYVVVEDICGQFTPEFVGAMFGREIINAGSTIEGMNSSCSYYLNEKDNLVLNLSYLTIENQRKGHEMMERKVESDPSIPMENLVVKQEDGLINSIYLVFSPNKFLSINRSNGINISEDEILNFARNLSKAIGDYQ